MTIGILRKSDNALTLMWLQLPPLARWALLARCDGELGELEAAVVAKVAAYYQKEEHVS